MNVKWIKSPMREMESKNRYSDLAFRTIFRISKSFKEATETIYYIYFIFLARQALKIFIS
jgi:hypothetical protein